VNAWLATTSMGAPGVAGTGGMADGTCGGVGSAGRSTDGVMNGTPGSGRAEGAASRAEGPDCADPAGAA
jgi:hypothetical protein